jgi:undecaprenyl diphosphate synthase
MSNNLSDARSLHVAIIMDGNGRWATNRGLARTAGHCAGVKTVRTVVEAAADRPIRVLTLFAFSADNWQRPRNEVKAIFDLMQRYLDLEIPECINRGVRISVIGRREGLSDGLRAAIDRAERATRSGARLWLRIALNYSSRDAILDAALRARPEGLRNRQDFARLLSGKVSEPVPDVDLMIRTGGERRLSDFLLWESAYAEIHFTNVSWPDFGANHLDEALADFYRRDRRFGAVSVENVAVGQSAYTETWLE